MDNTFAGNTRRDSILTEDPSSFEPFLLVCIQFHLLGEPRVKHRIGESCIYKEKSGTCFVKVETHNNIAIVIYEGK